MRTVESMSCDDRIERERKKFPQENATRKSSMDPPRDRDRETINHQLACNTVLEVASRQDFNKRESSFPPVPRTGSSWR